MNNKDREAFELWAKTSGHFWAPDLVPSRTGAYIGTHASKAWFAWQAALDYAAEQRADDDRRLEELRRALKACLRLPIGHPDSQEASDIAVVEAIKFIEKFD